MPAPVDHDEMRRRVVDVASRLLAKSGLGALTIRDVAREAGYSTTIVTHYFKNKQELLTRVYQHNQDRFVAVTEDALRRSGDDIRALMETTMLIHDHSAQWWRVWFTYVALLDSHPEIASLHRDFTRRQEARWISVLQSMEERGLLKPELNLRQVADRLMGAIIGLAIFAIFDPDAWPAERQHALVDAELDSILLASAKA